MTDVVISAEGLGKKYLIGHETRPGRYTALRDVIALGARTFVRKARDLASGRSVIEGDELEEFWALRDVNFEIGRGEVVGIIGRNGAGKSTLLKVLSRITEPTTGRVRVTGRVASLLEVGTGFHAELTGRENIFLNGAILGMRRAEIRAKFDEIVAFAGVEKFLDTPVKRYSSGMYVRLAFAVAAHLEPDILIVDEVLAVGDAEFQRRCLGKMREVSKGGRTVLFVTHNLAAAKNLTTHGLILDSGRKVFDGSANDAVARYSSSSLRGANAAGERSWGIGKHTAISAVRMLGSDGRSTQTYTPGMALTIEVELRSDGTSGLSLELILFDESRARIGLASSYQFHGQTIPSNAGIFRCLVHLQPLLLAAGHYSFDVTTSVPNSGWDHYVDGAMEFEVPFSNPFGREFDFRQSNGYGHLVLSAAERVEFQPVEGMRE